MRALRFIYFAIGIVAASIPVLFVIIWHSLTDRMPTGDEVDYLLKSYEGYRAFDSGVMEGLKTLYLDRLWKPIFVSQSHVPFLFLANGLVDLSLLLQSIFFSLLCLFLIYKIFRNQLSVPLSFLGSSFVMSQPWFINTLLGNNSENYGLVATLTVMWAMISLHNKPESSKWSLLYSFGLGLALVYRPFELGYLFFIDFCKRVFLFLKNSKMSTRFLFLSFALVPFLLLIGHGVIDFSRGQITIPLLNESLFPSGLFLYLGVSVLIYLRKVDKESRALLIQTFPVFIIFVVFYFYHGVNLIHWLHECTMGPLSSIGGQRGDRTAFQMTVHLINYLFHPLIVLPLLVAAVASPRRVSPMAAFNSLIYLSSIVFVAPLLTLNSSERYYFPMATTLLIVSFAFFWSIKKWWAIVGRALLIMGMLFNWIQTTLFIDPDFFPIVVEQWNSRSSLREIPDFPDPVRRVTKNLRAHLIKHKAKENSKVAILRAKDPEDHFLIEEWGINILFMRDQLGFRAKVPYGFIPSGLNDPHVVLKEALIEYDYLMVGKLEQGLSDITNPDTLISVHINELKKSNKLGTLPILYEGDIHSNSPGGTNQTFMIFKVIK